MNAKKLFSKVIATGMAFCMVASVGSGIVKANNSADTVFSFELSGGTTDTTAWRTKKDSSGAYMKCTDASVNGSGYYAQLYKTSGSCSNDHYFAKGVKVYVKNLAYQGSAVSVRFKGKPIQGGQTEFQGVWSPDNVNGYVGED